MKRLPALALMTCLCLAWLPACSRPATDTQSARVMPSPLPTFAPPATAQPSPPGGNTNGAKNLNLGNLNSRDRAASNVGNSNARTYSPPVSSAPLNLGVTLAGYNALREGMSYAEAVRVLGGSGTELSSGGAVAGYATVMYQWKASDGIGNMTAMFQNDRLINKAQFGLK